MTSTEMSEAPKPKKTRKPAKKAAKARSAAPKHDAIYAGLTPSDCPMACSPDRCVISGRGICAHPYKGGLQAGMQSPDAMRRLNEAKRVIGKRKLDIAFEE